MFEFLANIGSMLSQTGTDIGGLLSQIGQQAPQGGQPQMQPAGPMPESALMPAQSGMTNGIPVENLSTPLDRSLGTTQTVQEQPFADRLQAGLQQLQQGQQKQAAPQMMPLSRGQAAPMQAAQSPLMNPNNPYSEMLARMISGRYG